MMKKCLASFLALALLVAPSWAITNPGVYTLASVSVTTALTSSAQTAITDLDGATGASVVAVFSYGSGGTSAAVVVQTSCDGGTVYYDVAYFAFTTSTSTKYANLSGLTAKNSAAYAALAADGVNDGLLCPRMRAVITTVGTYVGTTLTVRASLR